MNGATFNQSGHRGNLSGLVERIFREEHRRVLAALERKLDVIAVLAFEEEPDYVLRAT